MSEHTLLRPSEKIIDVGSLISSSHAVRATREREERRKEAEVLKEERKQKNFIVEQVCATLLETAHQKKSEWKQLMDRNQATSYTWEELELQEVKQSIALFDPQQFFKFQIFVRDKLVLQCTRDSVSPYPSAKGGCCLLSILLTILAGVVVTLTLI